MSPTDLAAVWLNENSLAIDFSFMSEGRRSKELASCLSDVQGLSAGATIKQPQVTLIDCVVGYDQLMLIFDESSTKTPQCRRAVARFACKFLLSGIQSRAAGNQELSLLPVLTIPVFYDVTVAPDLLACASRSEMSVNALIECHSAAQYTVKALGFAPGFAYLGFVPSPIEQPRHAEPRLSVAAGSVGIAGRQTGVYPRRSPGGWQVIGRTPLTCFNPGMPIANASPFHLMQTVRFIPVSEAEFMAYRREHSDA